MDIIYMDIELIKFLPYQIFSFFLISCFINTIKLIPIFFNFITNISYITYKKLYYNLNDYDNHKITNNDNNNLCLIDNSIKLNVKHKINSLVLMRVYNDDSNANKKSDANFDETNQIIDAVLAKISKLNNVPCFRLIEKGQFMATYTDKPIQINKDIFFKIIDIRFKQDNMIDFITFSLLSNNLSASDINNFVRKIYKTYIEEIKNSLGNCIYFFDQKNKDIIPPQIYSQNDKSNENYKRLLLSNAPKQLIFTMTPFYSNKSFSNIYGKEIRTIEQRINFFLNNKDWYDKKGIPYQLGILLSGVPGSGKTSCIRAIANLTKRHIINVNFANITTSTQLKNMFYSDKIQVYMDNSMSEINTYFIPIEQRLYVLEELDAISDIVKQRTNTDTLFNDNNSCFKTDELTLMEILTILDGTIEIPGRIIIMTTNHPDILDKALIRPGRVDIQVNFKNCHSNQIAEIFEGYFDYKFPENRICELPNKTLTPAEVGQIFFKYINNSHNIDEIIKELNYNKK
jgi:SpoVK/Ycf46/Vps4 family AAA+-type ATPase